MNVRDSSNKLLYTKNLMINDGVERITYNYLEKNKKYYFSYVVEEYNIGSDNSTYQDNYELLKDVIETRSGISGNLYMVEAIERTSGINKINVFDDSKWLDISTTIIGKTKKSVSKDAEITISVFNYDGGYAYYLPEYANKEVYVSFKIKGTSAGLISVME